MLAMTSHAIRTTHTRSSTRVLATERLSFHTAGCRSQERSGIRTRLKDKLWLNTMKNSVFRLTPCTVILPRGHCCQVRRQIAVRDLSSRQHRRRISLLRRSLVRMLCHMVHMASRMRGMVDEPLQDACTPLYPAPPHVPNHGTTRYALAMSMSIDFHSRSGPLFSMFGRSPRNGSTSATYSYIHDLLRQLYVRTKAVRNHVDRVSERDLCKTLRKPPSRYTSYCKLYNFVPPVQVLKTLVAQLVGSRLTAGLPAHANMQV